MKTMPTWWETAEDHRFALDVLQLGLRRKMLMLIARGCTRLSQIESEFDLSPAQAEYHLRMLEKALVVKETAGGWLDCHAHRNSLSGERGNQTLN